MTEASEIGISKHSKIGFINGLKQWGRPNLGYSSIYFFP